MKVFTLKMNGRVYTEEVPTMSASSGAIAGLPPDEPPVRKRKRKFKTDIFQRIRNARLKEETMEDQNIISEADNQNTDCLLYTSPSPRDKRQSRMPSSA